MLPYELFLLGIAVFSTATRTPTAYPLDGSDLFSFVSRPDIRAPRFNVSIYKPELVTQGYWFTAPYGDLKARLPTTLYQPGQVGPHIYDGNGELVWSGAHLFDDRPTFDFKAAEYEGEQHLTFITHEDLQEMDSPGGSAVILDNTYQRVQKVEDRAGRGTMNMHEYTTLDDGHRALAITFESKLADLSVDGETRKLFIGNNGFSEVDTASGEPVFSWWALDHVGPTESLVDRPKGPGSYGSPWDAYHINSVDKNGDGDYLVSARYTNAIYKISGKDGHIIWRFGGSKSDFELQGFNMSSQHDARFQSDNETHVILTFFNNHSDGHHATATRSAALEVELDLRSMKARALRQWDRPDGGLTQLRGNAQRLPSDNMFVCWSENGYMSEHTPEGDLVMEAQMASQRLVSYRGFKMNFTAQPSEPIAVKAYVFGVDEGMSTTVTYVSWNGATEVSHWKFHSVQNGQLKHLGTTDKTGFETIFMTDGATSEVVVEALDATGKLLGKSAATETELPRTWLAKESLGHAGLSSVGNLDGTTAVEGDEQTSVSENLSTQLHQATTEEQYAQHDADNLENIGAVLGNPLFLIATAAVSAIVVGAYVVQRSKRRYRNRLHLGRYKAIDNEV